MKNPAILDVAKYLKLLGNDCLYDYQELFAIIASDGNILAEKCTETLDQLRLGEKVPNEDLLSLAWTIRNLEEGK